jgi:hypothetical protein
MPADCHATNARYNITSQPKSGYDFVPIVADDSLGFYVAYSAKQNDTNTDFVGTSCMYVLPLEGDEVLVFGGGFGDTWYIPGGAFFNADYDANFVKEIVTGCMGRDLAATRVRFVAPHGHPDHITVAFIRALERAGLTLVEIAYHEGDRGWIEQLPWLPHHPGLFRVLLGGACGEEIASYASPLGRLWLVHRPYHTPGSIDLVLDVGGDPEERVLLLGSTPGRCLPPPGVVTTLAAHGTALIDGPRRAQIETLTGLGVNRVCLKAPLGPKLGTTWTATVDVLDHAGASSIVLFGTDRLLRPSSLTPFGELMVDKQGIPLLKAIVPVLTGDKEKISFVIPRDAALMGQTCYAQATILGGGIEHCNALRLVIGF